MTTLWWRNPNGTATVTVSQTEPRTDAAPVRYGVVDRTDRQAMADWRGGRYVAPADRPVRTPVTPAERVAADRARRVADQIEAVDAELVCAECGWTYTGTYCDVCTPCDDCGRAPAACQCISTSTDPLD